MELNIERKVLIGFGMAMVVLLAIGVASYSSIRDSETDTDQALRIRDAERALVLIAAGSGLAIVFLGLAAWLIRRDLIARRRAEEELKATEGRFRATFEQAAVGMAIMDPEGRFLRVNQRFCEITGYTREELQAKRFQEITHPEDVDADVGACRRMVSGEIQTYAREKRYVRKDGSVAWVHVTVSAVRAAAGELPYFIVATRDVTDRKRAEEAARENEERYRDLVENTSELMGTHTLDGTILTVNRAFVRMLGYEKDEDVIGHKLDEFLAPEVRDQFPAYLEAVAREGHARGRMTVLNRFGEARVLEYDNSVRRDGSTDVVRGLARDITDQLRAEKAEREAREGLQHLNAELEQRTEEITRLSKMGEILQACQSPEEACQVITYAMQQLFPQASGLVCILSASRNLVESQAVWGDPPGERVFAQDECLALRRGQVHLTSDPSRGLACPHVDRSQPRISLCIPLMAQGETLGVMVLYFPFVAVDPPQLPLPEADRRVAIAAAEQVALSLANLRLRETLRNQSIRDALTGLFNRRYMEESLERELRRATRGKRPLAVLMLDLDHFKRFNDTFGHDAGDAMLRELAGFLLANVRGEDVACRFGGEEFALILPEATLEAAFERAEGLRKGVHDLHVQHHSQSLGAVTLSIGVAAFPTHGRASDVLLRSADQALYRAKHEGRDRVVLAQVVESRPTPSPHP